MNVYTREVAITEKVRAGGQNPLLVIAGPCQIESRDHALMMAEKIKQIALSFKIGLVYKSSFDKANRTSASGARGIGIEKGLQILAEVRREFDLPVLTDIHTVEQAEQAAGVVDILQTPAFLCRQTDLLLAAGKTGKTVNAKKGQFLSPQDMQFVAEKIAQGGSSKILLCERGTSFGYRDLVVDMRGLVIMRELGYPVVFDATHSVQSMGGAGGKSGGAREYVFPLARAAAAVGIDGLFLECHDNPSSAPSDGASMLKLEDLSAVLKTVIDIHNKAREIA